MEPYYDQNGVTIYLADCRAALPLFAPRSVDAVVTDPPYELGFMGRQWDRSGIANDPSVWTPLRHLLRPGGHLLAFGGTRTYHRMACAIEDAGFEIRDSMLYWGYGQGFPKSLNVSKVLAEKGLSCQCHKTMLQYPYEKECSPDGQAVHRVWSGVDTPDAVSGSAQSDLFTAVCRPGDQPEQAGATFRADPHSAMPALSADVCNPSVSREPPTDLLQCPVSRAEYGSATRHASDSRSRAPSMDRRESDQLPGEDDGRSEPGLEGGRYLLAETRELQADQVCSVPGDLSSDGSQGQLRDGASATDGPAHRSMPPANGSRASRRSRSSEQHVRQPGIVARQPQPQTSGAWPICPQCGLPVIPDGLGTALKPGFEPIVLARAPLSEPTVAANVARWGTGALNIDGCRLGWDAKGLAGDTKRRQTARTDITGGSYGKADGARPGQYDGGQRSPPGRWPANVVLSHTLFCEPVGMRRVRGAGWRNTDLGGKSRGGLLNNIVNRREPRNDHYADPDGTETVEDWNCAPDCPVAALDMQSGTRRSSGVFNAVDHGPNGNAKATTFFNRGVPASMYADAGGASRFFYCAKASPSERNNGLAERNTHPTVKPLALMRWLLTLVTPTGGMVLDPFAGSGSTLLAARALGITAVGVEQDEQSCEIAANRLRQQVLDLGA